MAVFEAGHIGKAGVLSAVLDDYFTVGTSESNIAVTCIIVYEINASPLIKTEYIQDGRLITGSELEQLVHTLRT